MERGLFFCVHEKEERGKVKSFFILSFVFVSPVLTNGSNTSWRFSRALRFWQSYHSTQFAREERSWNGLCGREASCYLKDQKLVPSFLSLFFHFWHSLHYCPISSYTFIQIRIPSLTTITTIMPIRLGSPAPNFTAHSTKGDIDFHKFLGDSWGILFSHPADFSKWMNDWMAPRMVSMI
jgi:hypothetical protein